MLHGPSAMCADECGNELPNEADFVVCFVFARHHGLHVTSSATIVSLDGS